MEFFKDRFWGFYYLCDLLLIMNHEDVANYADDNAPYVSKKYRRGCVMKALDFIYNLQMLFSNALVTINFQTNARKCHVLLSTDQDVRACKYSCCTN